MLWTSKIKRRFGFNVNISLFNNETHVRTSDASNHNPDNKTAVNCVPPIESLSMTFEHIKTYELKILARN